MASNQEIPAPLPFVLCWMPPRIAALQGRGTQGFSDIIHLRCCSASVGKVTSRGTNFKRVKPSQRAAAGSPAALLFQSSVNLKNRNSNEQRLLTCHWTASNLFRHRTNQILQHHVWLVLPSFNGRRFSASFHYSRLLWRETNDEYLVLIQTVAISHFIYYYHFKSCHI